MDYFAHGLWSYILFQKIKRPWLAVFFGILPDTVSWMIFFFYRLITGIQIPGRPDIAQIPDWVWTLYGISHSLIVFAVVWVVLYVVLKRIPLYIYAWPIHILIDIPTHNKDFLPTPFLWPIAGYAFPGISWGTPWFAALNYTAIFICLTYIVIKKKKAAAH